jgi:hypothetical protein
MGRLDRKNESPAELTPERIDALLTQLQSGHGRRLGECLSTNTRTEAEVLTRLVNTARSARLDSAFYARLSEQMRRVPVDAAQGVARVAWRVRNLALTVSSAVILLGFTLMSLLVPLTEPHLPTGYATLLADTAYRPVLLEAPQATVTAEALPPPPTVSTGTTDNARGRAIPQHAVQHTLTAAAAPTPLVNTPSPELMWGNSHPGRRRTPPAVH